MAKTIHNGKYLAAAASAATTLHTTAGRLLGIFISHAQGTVQTVTFYDNTAASGTVIMKLNIDPTRVPYFVMFDRDAGIPFSTGLHIVNNWCNMNVWSVDHG